MRAKKCKRLRKFILKGKSFNDLKEVIEHKIPFKMSVPDEENPDKMIVKEFIFKTLESNPFRKKYRELKRAF